MSSEPVLRAPGALLTSVLDGVAVASAQQRMVRLLAFGTVLAYAALVPLAGAVWHPALTALLVVLGASAVLLPDSNAPLAWMLLAVGFWMAVVPEAVSAWTLLGALDLLALHVLCLLCGYGPPALALDGSLLRAWAGRVTVLAAVTALVWLAALVAAALDLPSSALVLVAALAVVTGWTAYLLPRLLAREGAATTDAAGDAAGGRAGGSS